MSYTFTLPVRTNKIIVNDDFQDLKTATPAIIDENFLKQGYLQFGKFTDKYNEETANPLKII